MNPFDYNPPDSQQAPASDEVYVAAVKPYAAVSPSDRQPLARIRYTNGKTFVGQQFASALGYAPVETLFIYKDMTSRDLLQRRTTGSEKETLWQPTPLAIAVRTGRLAILDGINRLPPGTISALLRLIEDREVRAMCFLHQLTNARADC